MEDDPIEVTIHNVILTQTTTYTAEQLTILLPASAVRNGEADAGAVQTYFELVEDPKDIPGLSDIECSLDVESFDDD